MPTNIFQLKRYFVYALFVLASVIAVLTVFQIVTAAIGQPRMMVVIGDSMLPAIKPYDVVFLEPVDKDSIKVGEIVAADYRSRNALFSDYDYLVHRVIKVWEADGKMFMQTKGDNNRLPEMAAPAEKVAGRVSGSILGLGLLIGPPGNFIIIGTALLVAVSARRRFEKHEANGS